MKRFNATTLRRGAIAPLAALFIVFIVGLAAFAIDCGVITLARTQLQAAADAAAIAGADALSSGTTTATTAAQTIAQANYAGGAHVSVVTSSDVEFGTWDTSKSTFTVLTGAAASGANAVRVTCWLSQSRGTGLTLFFAPIWGHSVTTVSAQAVAMKGSPACGFVGLNSASFSGSSYTDSYDSSSGSYSSSTAGSNGNICGNGNISLSGGTVHGNATPGPGKSVTTSGSASVTGTTTAATQDLVESAIDSSAASTTNNNSSIGKSTKGHVAYNSSTKAFSLAGGDSITLSAGTYYFSSIKLSGGSTIKMSGATTVYVTGNVDLSGGNVATASSIPSNFKLYVQGSTANISGSSALYAELYAPSSAITRSATASYFGSIVGLSLNMSGSGGLHYDTSLGSSNKYAELVQ
jgi:Flp pilus assembly protein TadG